MSGLTLLHGGRAGGATVHKLKEYEEEDLEPEVKDGDDDDGYVFIVVIKIRFLWFMVRVAKYRIFATSESDLLGPRGIMGIDPETGGPICIIPPCGALVEAKVECEE